MNQNISEMSWCVPSPWTDTCFDDYFNKLEWWWWCPFVLHAVNSLVASHWHMLIIGSSQLTVLLIPFNLCFIILKMQNLFSDTWFPILQFMLDLELTSLNVRLSAPNFAQRRGTVSWSQPHNMLLQIKPRSQIPEIALVFSPSHCGLSGESYSLGFCMF